MQKQRKMKYILELFRIFINDGLQFTNIDKFAF